MHCLAENRVWFFQADRPAGLPQLLVCHDLAGGYTEGGLKEGGDPAAQDYYISHAWRAIDSFVYFSHKFVTIPPWGWVAAAHQHGTKVWASLRLGPPM